jgi:hypothetical protein
MTESGLPPCGLYKTRAAIGTIPAGRLVYFHNHGNPGPGLYLPTGWSANRATWSEQGHLLPSPDDARHLQPLPPEGFYRVREAFHCCAKQCRTFAPQLFVQLGYDGAGNAILFTPQLLEGVIGVPDRGTRIDDDVLDRLDRLDVMEPEGDVGVAIH